MTSETDTIYDTNTMYSRLSSIDIKTLVIKINEKPTKYHVVTGKFPYRKYEIGSYLLQKKYENIQNSTNILLNTKKINKPINVSASMICYYDDKSDTTTFQLCFDKCTTPYEKQQIQKLCGVSPDNILIEKGNCAF